MGRASPQCRPGMGTMSKHLRVESLGIARGLEVLALCLHWSSVMFRQTRSQTCIHNLVTCIDYPRTATRMQRNHSGIMAPGTEKWKGRYKTRLGPVRTKEGNEDAMPGAGVCMNTQLWGEEFPSKRTTLVPLLPKQKRKEHHSVCPPPAPNKTMGLKNTDGERNGHYSQNPSL